ncbi:unnamed protein product, partial [Strongylus vulgaris]
MNTVATSIFALITIAVVTTAFRTQSVAVKGKLMCGDQPAPNVLVKLLDEDHGDPDDVLDNMYTKEDGMFSVSGFASEITPIDPELRIYHDCNDNGKPCKREWIIRIPSKYIYLGEEPSEALDLGTLNLERMRFPLQYSLLLTLFGYVFCVPQQQIGRQNYRVRGTLMCGTTPAKDVKVKLIDDDFGPDPDDELDSGYTDANGFFELAGFTTERTTIDPHLKFYHDCNDGI